MRDGGRWLFGEEGETKTLGGEREVGGDTGLLDLGFIIIIIIITT